MSITPAQIIRLEALLSEFELENGGIPLKAQVVALGSNHVETVRDFWTRSVRVCVCEPQSDEVRPLLEREFSSLNELKDAVAKLFPIGVNFNPVIMKITKDSGERFAGLTGIEYLATVALVQD